MEAFREVVRQGSLLQHSTGYTRTSLPLRRGTSSTDTITRHCDRASSRYTDRSSASRPSAVRRLDPVRSSDTASAQQNTHTDTRFRWTSCLSKQHMLDEALSEVIQGASAPLRDAEQRADVAVVFVSGAHTALDCSARITSQLREHLPSLQCIFGASGMGVIGGFDGTPHEAELRTSIVLCLGSLPGVEAHTVHVNEGNLPDADASPEAWQTLFGVPIDTNHHVNFILAGSPMFRQMQDLLGGLDFAYPEATKLGGLCSGSAQHLPNLGEPGNPPTARPTWPAFCWNANASASSGVITEGCSVLVLHGNVMVEPLICQGCRALSDQTFTITKLKRNLVLEVSHTHAGRRRTTTTLRALQADLDSLGDDRKKAASNVTIGLACDDFKPEEELEPSDFVVRSLMGASHTTGALLIAAEPRLGQRLRFMVRDKEGAMKDLQDHGIAHKRRAFQASLEGKPQAPAFGAFMFTCNGRGSRLYGENYPSYDARTLHDFVPVPSVGFFCNGEIGQVGKSTYLHGFTCAAGILREMPKDDS